MSAGQAILSQLQKLLADGNVPRRACSGRLLKAIAPLAAAGVIREERSGSGRRFRVVNPTALDRFIQDRFPSIVLPVTATAREKAVAQFRDTKALPGDTSEIVVLRTWSEASLNTFVSDDQGINVLTKNEDAARATAAYGVFAFVLRANCPIRLCGRWALVENPVVFQNFERLRVTPACEGALHGRGKISGRLLAWLADQPESFSLLHLPDYDPAGLVEYERVRARIGSRASLYLPDNLDARFARFSNPALLRKPRTRGMLARLRRSQSAEILCALELIEQYSAGLEQESLLID